MKLSIKSIGLPALLGIGIFFTIFVFFTQAHPIYPYDADDWTYLYHTREAYININEYNPTRILPELLMPACGWIAMNVAYPIVNDITTAVCITSSLLLALLISIYMLLFYQMAHCKLTLSRLQSFILTLIFFVFHFLFLRHQEQGNEHLFYSFDLCCHYNYTIPNIIASSFVLLFITKGFEIFNLKNHLIGKGIFFLLLYLTILSHLFGSVILITYLASHVFIQFIALRRKTETFNWRAFGRRYILHLSIIGCWLAALPFEAFGKRASDVSNIAQTTLGDSLIESARNLKNVFLYHTNGLAITFVLISLSAYLIIVFASKRKKESTSLALPGTLLLSFMLCCAYLILMAAKSYPYYILRAMTVYAAPFYLILLALVCAATIINRKRQLAAILPFLLLLFSCNSVRQGNTFLDVQTLTIPQKIQGNYCIPINEIPKQNRQYISTIIKADQEGESEVSLVVPYFDHIDNWPIANYYGMKMSRFLSRFNLISKRIKVNIIPNQSQTDEQIPHE